MQLEPITPFEPKSSAKVPDGEDWLAQVKWDGVRLLTYFNGKEVRLFNRKKHERTLHYPELKEIRSYCTAASIILDGEIIALGEDGKPSFPEVMRRDGLRRLERVQQVRGVVPISYMIFDVLYVNGQWINRLPLTERIGVLSDRINPTNQIQLVSSNDDGRVLFRVIQEHGMEGVVMKKKDSPYLIGEKSDLWVKVKNYRDLIAVIGGFTLSGGVVNAVLLGLYDQKGDLWYIGHAGTGKMRKKEWRDLTQRLHPLVMTKPPFVNKPERCTDAYWVQPAVTVKIKYAEWTEGRALRQPSIQGFVDVPPEQCVMNEPSI